MKLINKIIVFRLSSIGDIILTTALIRCIKLKYPDAHLSFVVKKEFNDLIKYNPHIDKIYSYDKKSGLKGLLTLKKEIKSEKFDWFADIHNNIRSNIIKRGLPIPVKTRYHKRIFYRTLLIRFKLNWYKNNKPVLLRYFEAAEKLGITYDNKGSDIIYSDSEKVKVFNILKENNYNPENIAVICPGASYSNKQWKLEGFAKIAVYLLKNKRLKVVLLGGQTDVQSCEYINEKTGRKCLNIAGQLKLLESAALLALSKITITNDSGMMHMAQSQNSPVVAIFGPTTKELGYFPLPEKSHVIEKDVNCRPCTHKGLNYCPKKHFNCMNNISENDVINGIEALI